MDLSEALAKLDAVAGPDYWLFDPTMTVTRNADGTLRVVLDISDSFRAAYKRMPDGTDEEYTHMEGDDFPDTELAPQAVDAWIKTNQLDAYNIVIFDRIPIPEGD